MITVKTLVVLLGSALISCEVVKFKPHAANTIVLGSRKFILRSKHPMAMLPSHNSFLQQGTNMFYKPHFMMPSTHTAPLISEKLNRESGYLPYVLQNAPGIVMSQPININAWPESPEYNVPFAPAEDFSVTNCDEHKASPQEISLQPLPELPQVLFEESLDHETAIIEEPSSNSISVVPEAPVLPTFVMAEIPEIVEHSMPEEPCDHINDEDSKDIIEVPIAPAMPPVPEFSSNTIFETEIIEKIPDAPVLGSFVMPELPTFVEHDVAAPTVPETSLPCEYLSTEELHIPYPPKLPSLVEVTATTNFETPIAPIILDESLPEIAGGPVLSPFVMPELPSLETLTAPELFSFDHINDGDSKDILQVPIAPALPPSPEFFSNTIFETLETLPVIIGNIPAAPVLPTFVMPELSSLETLTAPALFPSDHINDEDSKDIIEVPIAPTLPLLPEFSSKTIIETEIIENIPDAPVLGSFEMPQLPTFVEHDVAAPTVPETLIPCEYFSTEESHILDAPELPSITNFETPTAPIILEESLSEIAEGPVLPPFVISKLPSLETLTAPELFPTEIVAPENTIEIISEPEVQNVVEIPEAPVLQPFSLFEIPTHEVEHSEPEVLEKIEIAEDPETPEPTIIETPIISEPTLIEVNKPCESTGPIKIERPSQHSGFLPYPVFYAQNIIIERVVPNMIINSEKFPVNALPLFTNEAVPLVEESLSS